MRKLLRANFSRLRRDRVFWSLSALTAVSGGFLAAYNAVSSHREGVAWVMDFILLTYVALVPVFISVFTALFIGSDYSGGTLRNKLIAGHRRSHIYLADLLTCCCVGLILCIVFIIPQGALGLILGGRIGASWARLLMYGGLGLALTAAFTALFTLIAMLCQNRSYTVAGCILLAFVLILTGIYMAQVLNEPEYLTSYSYTVNGVTAEEPGMKNPNYISGIKRQIYEFMQNFIPGGQVLLIRNMNAEKPALLALYDGIILLAATGLGMIFFRRKNLK